MTSVILVWSAGLIAVGYCITPFFVISMSVVEMLLVVRGYLVF
jgi:hypothetical protein